MSEKFFAHLSEACTDLLDNLPQSSSPMDSVIWREKFNADLKATKAPPKPKGGVQGLSNRELLEKYEALDFKQRMARLF